MEKRRKSIQILIVMLLVLILGFLFAYHYLHQTGDEGAKTIHVSIVVDEATINPMEIHTNAAYLRQALEERGLIQGKDSVYGLMVTTVNGKTADATKQEWWCFTKGGEILTTGVDETPLKDGDSYEITLRAGYDQ